MYLDGSSIAISKATDYLNKFNLSAKYICSDAVSIDLPNNSVDLVLDIECIYANSSLDSIKIISEIKRVLKPGGFFFYNFL